jgi:hypothetical protein
MGRLLSISICLTKLNRHTGLLKIFGVACVNALKHQKINQSFNKKYVLFKICGRFDFHFEAVLTWGRFDGGSFNLGTI